MIKSSRSAANLLFDEAISASPCTCFSLCSRVATLERRELMVSAPALLILAKADISTVEVATDGATSVETTCKQLKDNIASYHQ